MRKLVLVFVLVLTHTVCSADDTTDLTFCERWYAICNSEYVKCTDVCWKMDIDSPEWDHCLTACYNNYQSCKRWGPECGVSGGSPV